MRGLRALAVPNGSATPEAAVAHVDLAVAYLDMGLFADALFESALAIAARAPAPYFGQSVGVLLDPRLAGPGILQRLRAVLFRGIGR